MKKCVIFLPVLLTITMFSCINESSSFTPDLSFSYFLLNPVYEGEKIVSAEDTLYLTARENYFVLDTIDVEDTVVFMVACCSYENDLIALRVNFDTTQLNMNAKVVEETKKALLSTTDYRNLQFYINPGYNTMYMPFGYSPVQSGSHQFSVVVESDSKYSPNSTTFCQPVR